MQHHGEHAIAQQAGAVVQPSAPAVWAVHACHIVHHQPHCSRACHAPAQDDTKVQLPHLRHISQQVGGPLGAPRQSMLYRLQSSGKKLKDEAAMLTEPACCSAGA